MKIIAHSIASAAAALFTFVLPVANASVIVHSTDFISDATRTGFNGFESIPTFGGNYTEPEKPYTEGGITVAQVNGDFHGIWVNFHWAGAIGKSWYPSFGDHGYTTITLFGGGNFDDVGMNVGTGSENSLVVYELLNNGSVVASGTSSLSSQYLGFSGGGFDTIRLRDDGGGSNSDVTNGTFQALAIDSIEVRDTAVPEPASLGLLGLGLVGLGVVRRKKS